MGRAPVEITSPSRRGVLAGIGAAGVSFGALGGCAARGPRLNLYTWDTYIGETTLDDFRAATGIAVDVSLFSTNDELFAKLRGGNPGYDVIVPTSDFVERMIGADMLAPLDRRRLPNFRNVAAPFRDAAFDPGRRYSMPYTWLVIGIGYRKSRIAGVPDSWKWVLDSDRYTGRIGLLGESADLCRLALRYLGEDPNTTSRAALRRVEDLLIRQKPNVALFHDDNGQDLLLGGDLDIAIEYNGDIAQVMREDGDIAFVIPREGSEMSQDCLAIPKGAPNPALAHRFIDFLLDARVGAGIAETIRYPTPNSAAAALMPAEYRDDPVIFPPAAALGRCAYSRYTGEAMARAYDYSITRVRAA